MDEKIKLPEIVMLVDAAFLNFIVSDLKRYFENVLNRPLQEIDLSLLTTYLALDAGIEEGVQRLNDRCCFHLIQCNFLQFQRLNTQLHELL